jgi:hypothetical protein
MGKVLEKVGHVVHNEGLGRRRGRQKGERLVGMRRDRLRIRLMADRGCKGWEQDCNGDGFVN